MNLSPIINELLKLWWIVPALLVIGVLKSPWFKGVLGEALVNFTAWLGLPVEIYHRIHDVTLPTPDGTTQIDHIFVSRFGIFVVETKNMRAGSSVARIRRSGRRRFTGSPSSSRIRFARTTSTLKRWKRRWMCRRRQSILSSSSLATARSNLRCLPMSHGAVATSGTSSLFVSRF